MEGRGKGGLGRGEERGSGDVREGKEGRERESREIQWRCGSCNAMHWAMLNLSVLD